MKILYVDLTLSGHHKIYLNTFIENNYNELVLIAPKNNFNFECKQYNPNFNYKNSGVTEYLKLIIYINKIAKKEKPDIIHFLYGDIFYRYLGLGLGLLNKYKILMTFHQIRRSKLRDISIRRICKKITHGIVHTKALKDTMNSMAIKNIEHIEYPQLDNLIDISKEDARKKLNINSTSPVLLAIGATRQDKGLDILLEALKNVNSDFYLIIAGKESSFKYEFIKNKIQSYSDKVTLILRRLTDEEYSACVSACDIVVLPYRKSFDGASGPLTSGVWYKKYIVGPNHGSLNDIILENNLGTVFESEDINDLTQKLELVLNKELKWEIKQQKYRDSLDKSSFIKRHNDLYDCLYNRNLNI